MIYLKWNEFVLEEYPFGYMSKITKNDNENFYYINWNCDFYINDKFDKTYCLKAAQNRNLKVLKSHYQTIRNVKRIVFDRVMCYD